MNAIDHGDVSMRLIAGLTDPAGESLDYAWLREVMQDVLGIQLLDGTDDERGTHVAHYESQERGLIGCEVVYNSGTQPRHWQRVDRNAVVEIDLIGPLLELGRVAEHLHRLPLRGALRLMSWRVMRPFRHDQLTLAVGGEYGVDDTGAPSWLAPTTTDPMAGYNEPVVLGPGTVRAPVLAPPWRCQLVASIGAGRVADIPPLVADLVRSPWRVGRRDEELAAAAPTPFELSGSAMPNQHGSTPPVIAARPAAAVILQLSWLATSLVEPGWLAALLEQRGFAAVEYRVAGSFVDDGLMRMLIGDGTTHVALHPISDINEAADPE